MKAIITTRYGTPDVLKIVEVKKPKPNKNELLIKNKAIAVTSGDCRMRALNPPYWFYRIPMYLMLGIFRPRKPTGIFFSVISSGHAKFGVKELNFLTTLVNDNKLRSVLDVCYSFDQMVEAHRYVDKGHKKGNVAVILE